MTDNVTVKISGLDELQKKLEACAKEVSRQVVRNGLRAGGGIVRDEMVRRAPKDTGFLSEHIDIKTRVMKADVAGTAMIGPNSKAVYPVKGNAKRSFPAFVIARFLEFGTSHKGFRKQPFLTPAWEATKGRALDAIVNTIREAIAKFTTK
jgi:HK97 gp10 family phage protein